MRTNYQLTFVVKKHNSCGVLGLEFINIIPKGANMSYILRYAVICRSLYQVIQTPRIRVPVSLQLV
jgi:hypothetical protein